VAIQLSLVLPQTVAPQQQLDGQVMSAQQDDLQQAHNHNDNSTNNNQAQRHDSKQSPPSRQSRQEGKGGASTLGEQGASSSRHTSLTQKTVPGDGSQGLAGKDESGEAI